MTYICNTLAVFLAIGCFHDVVGSDTSQPNIIVIFTDDHGYADLSCQGSVNDIKTPHIDALANGGVRMTSGYVTAPQCVPSRAGLMSGRYQNRFGVEHNKVPLEGFNAQQTIAERLRSAGYATGMIGKWHLGRADEIVTHGFDDVFYMGGAWTNYDIQGKDVKPGTKFNQLYRLDAESAAARAFIKRHHERPFFLYLAYRAPHVPLDATEKYLRRFPGKMPHRRRQALAMLSAVDDGVGGVVDALRQYGIEENTLVFFIGDNGAPLKIHKLDAPGGGPGWDGSLNDPMNGEKGMLSEGGIRVPFVAYWKGKLPAGQIFDQPFISLDVAATATALAGLPRDERLDGVNLIPYLCGEQRDAPHEQLFWRWIAQSAVREGQWKYLRGGAREYLFDMSVDKEEKHNLLAQHPEIVARLRSKLTRWASGLQPPGLETKQMSPVWEQYYDYYLDGKPAPKPRLPSQPGRQGRNVREQRIRGWLVRGGNLALADGALQVRSMQREGNPKTARLFIVAAGLELPPPLTAGVELRAKEGGTAAFAWREQGQKDFVAGQVVKFECPESTEWQKHVVDLPANGKVIHVRLFLPSTGVSIKSIEFQGADKKPLRTWQFGTRTK